MEDKKLDKNRMDEGGIIVTTNKDGHTFTIDQEWLENFIRYVKPDKI